MTTHNPITGFQNRTLPAATLEIREADDGAREVAGIGVPYNQEIEFWGIREKFAPGSVEVADNAMLFYGHREPIGKIISHSEEADGWHHRSVISKTTAGDDAYTLALDGVLTRFSIGFQPIEHLETKDEDGTITITHTKVLVREVSLVPIPAYDGATLTDVRHHPRSKEPTMTDTTTTADIADLREGLEDIKRTVHMIREDTAPVTPTADTRSAGELLKAAVKDRDEDALAVLTRAYTGGTTADTVVKDAWVGDLTRLIDQGAGIRPLFATGALPAEGMQIEYAQLKSDTTQVTEQAAEGDDLAFGKVEIETKNAPIKTYGGYTTLSRQQIERASVNHLDHTLRAMALAAGRAQLVAFRAHYATAVTAQRTANNTVDVPSTGATYSDWLAAVIDAVEKFDDLGLTLEGLIADKTTFKEFAALTDGNGRPLFVINSDGSNTVGKLDVTTLRGNLSSVEIHLNAKATNGAAFYNRLAIRSYESPLAQLQDENIINLSKDFSVYRYAALANENPAAIVPVKRTTSGD